MGIYSLAVRTSVTTSPNAAVEIIGSTNLGYRMLELGITINAATASTFGYGPNNAIGGTPVSTTVITEDRGNSTLGNSNVALTWTTQPTAPTAYFRRVSLPATVGAGIIWTFPRGISVLKTASTVLYNITVTSVADVWVVVDE